MSTTAPRQMKRINVSADEERAVHVDDISKELGRLWGQISQEIEGQTGHIPLRTSILTLMIVAQGKHEQRNAHETLHELSEQVPSRAVVIEVNDPGTPVDAAISAHCRMLDQGKAACYEVIEIRAPQDGLAAVPSLLVPLELFDVPSFMWWVGPFEFDSPAFRRMTASAERIIIDTSRFDSALQALADYNRFLQSTDTACTGTDLTWARTTGWRELIAQTFDHPATLGLLPTIHRVEFSFDPSAESQALLMTGWLATRLDWRLVDAKRTANTMTLSLTNPAGRQIEVELSRQALTGIGLRSVRLVASIQGKTTRITLRRREGDIVVVAIESAAAPRQERVIRDILPTRAELLGRELLVYNRDRVFDESLDFVAQAVHLLEAPIRR